MTGHRVSPGGPSLIRVNTNHPKGSRLLAETTGGQRRSRNAHGCFRPCVVLRSGRTTENRRPFWSEKRNAEFKPLSTVDTIVCDMTLPLMLCWTCTVPSLIKGMATGSNWKHGASQHPSRFHMGSGTRSHFTPPMASAFWATTMLTLSGKQENPGGRGGCPPGTTDIATLRTPERLMNSRAPNNCWKTSSRMPIASWRN